MHQLAAPKISHVNGNGKRMTGNGFVLKMVLEKKLRKTMAQEEKNDS